MGQLSAPKSLVALIQNFVIFIATVIPPKRNRKVQPIIDGHLYALRNLVERCFSKLKHSRRLATRYDKTADSYLGFILVASIRLWVRHFVNRT